MQFYAVVPLLLAGASVAGAIMWSAGVSFDELFGWPLFFYFLAVIPVHEMVHTVAHPGFGLRPPSVVGVWPAKLVCFSHYEGELSRERFLGIMLSPFMVLTVLPTLLICALALESRVLAYVALANALGAAGDLFGAALLLRQIPRRAIVRNRGWRTYWRDPRDSARAGS